MRVIRLNPNHGSVNYPSSKYFRENIIQYETFVAPIKQEYGDKKINLLVTGSSGLLFGAFLMMHLPNTELIHFRKDNDNSHGESIEYKSSVSANDINILVDDFICTGDTLQFITDKIFEKRRISNITQIHAICLTGSVNCDKIRYIIPDTSDLLLICNTVNGETLSDVITDFEYCNV